MKNIYLLGATGSIGSQSIEIIDSHPDEFKLVAISGYSNLKELQAIASSHDLQLIAVKDEADALIMQKLYPNVKVVFGESGLVELARLNPQDKTGVLINALVGMVGLRPTVEAIKCGRDILLANKETLVVGGHLIKDLLIEHPVKLYPLDSEHNAIWQIMNKEDKRKIKQIIITASGGPFRDIDKDAMKGVTLADALNHPNWSMGKKITIDSATMMNKGFEIIEAAYLFDVDIDKITAVIHRESIIHSLVEYEDNSMIAQLANHDMRLPISYAMFYPERRKNMTEPLSLSSIKALTFMDIDKEKYPLLPLAINCYKEGGSKRTALNAANEAAVKLFLEGKIAFTDIETIVIETVNKHQVIADPSLEEIYEIDREIKESIFSKYVL